MSLGFKAFRFQVERFKGVKAKLEVYILCVRMQVFNARLTCDSLAFGAGQNP